MFDFFKKMGLDLKSVIATSIILPVLTYIVKVVAKHVKTAIQNLTEFIMFLLSRYFIHSLAASYSMRQYCKFQLADERIKFLSIPSTVDKVLDIDQIFVNLTITYQEKENTFNHKDFLTIGNRIKVMGDPGAGKSSLVKKVFRERCMYGLKKPGKTKLPILVELKNIIPPTKKSTPLGKWFYDYVKNEVSENMVYKMAECFENYSSTAGVLILLDGLDEVSSVNYSIIAKSINAFSSYLNQKNPNNVIVLTMRTQFHQQIKSDFNKNFPHATFLNPFAPSDIYEFLSKWHFEKEAERNISRIYKDLTDRPTLREMCSNPLILSMYVAEDQIAKRNISPESRTQFYKKITEELIIKRRLEQNPTTHGSYTSLKEQRERILGKIAYNHLISIDEPKNTLKWKNAIEIIKEVLKCDDSKAAFIFNEIATETGLITQERINESFRFIHLTFCEFLAAFEVIQGIEDGWNKLVLCHKTFAKTNTEGKSRLIEVIPFAAGLLPRISREQALIDIATTDDTTLMSRCFLETKLYSHASWSNFIKTSRDNLLSNIGSNFDEKWLQDLHIFNVVVRDANLASLTTTINGNIDLSEFYENLLDNDKNRLSKILSAFATQDAAAVFRVSEIGNINLLRDFPSLIIQNCDQTPFLGLIKDKIIQNENDAEHWSALLAESALQKKLVCDLLNIMPHDEQLKQRINESNSYRIWYYKKYIPETFFTQCLTLSTKSKLNEHDTKNLNIVMELKSPFEIRNRLIFYNYLFISSLVLFLFLTAVSVNIEPTFKKNRELEILYTAVAVFFEILSVPSFILQKTSNFFYRTALNIDYPFVYSKSGYSIIPRILFIFFLSNKNKQILKRLEVSHGDI